MKTSFNKNADPKKVMDFLVKTLDGASNFQDAFETIALALLPVLKASRKELDEKARSIPALYDFLMDDVDAADLSAKIRSVSRDDVLKAINGTKQDDPLKEAEQFKSRLMALNEDDYVTMTLALDGILPPGLKAAADGMSNGKDPDTDAREIYRLGRSLSVAEIAEAMAERRKQLDKEKLATGLHDMLQQCTPQRLGALIEHVNENLGGAALGLLVKRFWDFADETLSAAEKGNFLQPANPGKVRAFGRALNDTLTTLEDGMTQAGFTLPAEVSQYMGQALNTGKMLRGAAGSKQGAELKKGATDDITVGKPIQFKKPGFEL
jgi:hypothetical protein